MLNLKIKDLIDLIKFLTIYRMYNEKNIINKIILRSDPD